MPVPAIDPGLIVHVPVAGSPLNATLPDGTAHEEGWVIKPTIGVAGIPEGASMTTLAEAGEVHPVAFVTVKLLVPSVKPEIVKLVPLPAIAPGLIVQLPAGKLLSNTLPVGTSQVGWVMVPSVGAIGAPTIISIVAIVAH